MKVGQAVIRKGVLKGIEAVQYLRHIGRKDAYGIRQVTASQDEHGKLFIERHRGFSSSESEPWPRWMVTRGSACARMENEKIGFGGLWLPHVDDLTADCKIVKLKKSDRPISKKLPTHKTSSTINTWTRKSKSSTTKASSV